jgi:GT2 family glycosyltransferase
VTAVVLHWGEPEVTARCLRALLAGAGECLSVLVVDSGTAVDWAALDARGRIEVLRPARNEGYAGGNNLALRTARERGAAYALLLNNDAEITPDALPHLLQCAERDARIAFVGSRLAAPDDPTRDTGSCGRITYGPFLVDIEGGDPGGPARDVEWVSGCGMLVRVAALADVGLMDEEFFLYCEDVDWCLRARRLGYRVLYEPHAVVFHRPPAAIAAVCRRAYFLARNGLLFARKHGTGPERLKISAWALILPFASVLRRLLAGEPLVASAWVARGVVDGFLRRPPRLRQLGLR